MKITFITVWMGGPGGLEFHTVHLINCLQMRGHNVTVVQFDHDYYGTANIDRKESVRFVRVDLHKPVSKIGLIHAIKILSGVRGDVCVLPKGTIRAGSWTLDMAARVLFRRYVTIEHLAAPPPERASRRHLGGLLPGLGLWWYKTMFFHRLRAFAPSQVICVSDMVRGLLLKTYGFPAGKTISVNNGIDPQRFDMNPRMRSVRRSEWGASPETLVFGAIGRLETVKGYDVLIPLFARLVEQYSGRPLMMVLIGEGGESGQLRRMIKEHGLEDKVLLPGPTDSPWGFYPAIDVFLMPSRNEGLPFALLEAMASGCVPIGMSVGGVPEVIVNPETGWLVQAGDEAGFFDAMAQAVERGHAGLSRMGKSARALVVSSFNADRQYGKLADLLEIGHGQAVKEIRAG